MTQETPPPLTFIPGAGGPPPPRPSANDTIRVNSSTGEAWVVDSQGNSIRRAPEFDVTPKAATPSPLTAPGASPSTYQEYVGAGPQGSIYRDASGYYWYNGGYYTQAELASEIAVQKAIAPPAAPKDPNTSVFTAPDGSLWNREPDGSLTPIINPTTGAPFAAKVSNTSAGGGVANLSGSRSTFGGGGSAPAGNSLALANANTSLSAADIAAQRAFTTSERVAAEQWQAQQASLSNANALAMQGNQLGQQASQFAQTNALARQQQSEQAAKDYGTLVSSTDTAALPAFKAAGGGNIINALASGANMLTPDALAPGAMALANARAGGAIGSVANPYLGGAGSVSTPGSGAPPSATGGAPLTPPVAAPATPAVSPYVPPPPPPPTTYGIAMKPGGFGEFAEGGSITPTPPGFSGEQTGQNGKTGSETAPGATAPAGAFPTYGPEQMAQSPFAQYQNALGLSQSHEGTIQPASLSSVYTPGTIASTKPGDSWYDTGGQYNWVDDTGNVNVGPATPAGMVSNGPDAMVQGRMGAPGQGGAGWGTGYGINNPVDPAYNHPTASPYSLYQQTAPIGAGVPTPGSALWAATHTTTAKGPVPTGGSYDIPSGQRIPNEFGPPVFKKPVSAGGGPGWSPWANAPGSPPPAPVTWPTAPTTQVLPATVKKPLPAYARGGQMAGVGIVGDPPPGSHRPNKELVIAPHGAQVIPLHGRSPQAVMAHANPFLGQQQAPAAPSAAPPPMGAPGRVMDPMEQMVMAHAASAGPPPPGPGMFAGGGKIPAFSPAPMYQAAAAKAALRRSPPMFAGGGGIRPYPGLVNRLPLGIRVRPPGVAHFDDGGSITPTPGADGPTRDGPPPATSMAPAPQQPSPPMHTQPIAAQPVPGAATAAPNPYTTQPVTAVPQPPTPPTGGYTTQPIAAQPAPATGGGPITTQPVTAVPQTPTSQTTPTPAAPPQTPGQVYSGTPAPPAPTAAPSANPYLDQVQQFRQNFPTYDTAGIGPSNVEWANLSPDEQMSYYQSIATNKGVPTSVQQFQQGQYALPGLRRTPRYNYLNQSY